MENFFYSWERDSSQYQYPPNDSRIYEELSQTEKKHNQNESGEKKLSVSKEAMQMISMCNIISHQKSANKNHKEL